MSISKLEQGCNMILITKSIKCPCCKKDLTIRYATSGYRDGIMSDLSGIGPCRQAPSAIICKYCQYTFYYPDKTKDKTALKEFIFSDKYKKLVKKYLSMPHYLIYQIYEEQKASAEDKLMTLLFNYYSSSYLDSFKIFVQYIEDSKPEHIEYEFLRGEYYRRIREFDKAKEIFLSIKQLKTDDLKKHCDLQLQFIEQQDDSLQQLCIGE